MNCFYNSLHNIGPLYQLDKLGGVVKAESRQGLHPDHLCRALLWQLWWVLSWSKVLCRRLVHIYRRLEFGWVGMWTVVAKMFPRDGPSTAQRRLFKREQVWKIYPTKRSDKLRYQGTACCVEKTNNILQNSFVHLLVCCYPKSYSWNGVLCLYAE